MSLELALLQLEKSEHYELMTPVFKLLLPYYEEAKDFKVNYCITNLCNYYCVIFRNLWKCMVDCMKLIKLLCLLCKLVRDIWEVISRWPFMER